MISKRKLCKHVLNLLEICWECLSQDSDALAALRHEIETMVSFFKLNKVTLSWRTVARFFNIQFEKYG